MAPGRFSYGDFLWNRLARVYPLHLVTLAGVGLDGRSRPAWPASPSTTTCWPGAPCRPTCCWSRPGASRRSRAGTIRRGRSRPSGSPISASPPSPGPPGDCATRPRLAVGLALALIAVLYPLFQKLAGFPLTEATIHWGFLRIVPCFAYGCALHALWRSGAVSGRFSGMGACLAGASVLLAVHFERAGSSDRHDVGGADRHPGGPRRDRLKLRDSGPARVSGRDQLLDLHDLHPVEDPRGQCSAQGSEKSMEISCRSMLGCWSSPRWFRCRRCRTIWSKSRRESTDESLGEWLAGSDDLPRQKPDKQTFHISLRGLSLNPSDAGSTHSMTKRTRALWGSLAAAAMISLVPMSGAQADGYWQCVPFARLMSGIQIFGDARTWWSAGRRQVRYGLRAQAPAPFSASSPPLA
jgi:hypothetical protein